MSLTEIENKEDANMKCTLKVFFFYVDREDLPKGPVVSVINWFEMNSTLPYSFIFLLGMYDACSNVK